MREIKGDLVELAKEGRFDLIVHGCNCQCTMRSGIAKQITEEWPKVAQDDLNTLRIKPSFKLGTYIKTPVTKDLSVISAYTQLTYGYSVNIRYVNYDAIATVFEELNRFYKDKRVGIPMLGAGLAHGNWEIIQNIIQVSAPDLDITVVIKC